MGGIGLNKSEISLSGTLAVSGTIVMRFLTGPLCDTFGARKSFVLLLLLAVPGICGIMATTEPVGFILCRFLIGLGLATFVTCQVWCSQMFTKSVVGIANATAGGWGNLGGGVTQLVMPFVMLGMLNATGNDISRSWRLCFIPPLVMHLLSAIYIMGGKALPDGNYKELETSGAKQKVSGLAVAKVGFSNVNAWIMLITYGMCFGVELTMNSVAALYFYDYHGLTPQTAGLLASLLPHAAAAGSHFKSIEKEREVRQETDTAEPQQKRLKLGGLGLAQHNINDEVARLSSEVATLKHLLVNRMKDEEDEDREDN